VPLHGFKGFLGGLDNERDLTGEMSVYTKFEELEIMFHVSTLLPFSPRDTQQVSRQTWGPVTPTGCHGAMGSVNLLFSFFKINSCI